jgi:hypothetical protein
VITCNRMIWRDISPEAPAHPEAWVMRRNSLRGAPSAQIVLKMFQNCSSHTPGFLDRVLGCRKIRHLIAGITEFNAKGCQRFRRR